MRTEGEISVKFDLFKRVVTNRIFISEKTFFVACVRNMFWVKENEEKIFTLNLIPNNPYESNKTKWTNCVAGHNLPPPPTSNMFRVKVDIKRQGDVRKFINYLYYMSKKSCPCIAVCFPAYYP